MKKMLWLAAYFPLLGLEGHLLGSRCRAPAVLVADNRVVQANKEARLAGIEIGSTLATAHTILPELVHFARDPAAELRRLELLGHAGYHFTPRVSLAPPDAVLLEVRGSLRLPWKRVARQSADFAMPCSGLTAITDELAARCRRLGHEASMAAAATPLAALVLARSAAVGAPQGDVDALHDDALVNGALVNGALVNAALIHTDLPPKDLERLANMGITRIGELRKLPAWELGKRFGPALVDYLARLTGQKADPREYIEPPETFRSSVHLLEPIRGKGALLLPMRRLLAELVRWLARRQLGVNTLTWTVEPLSGPATALTVEFAEPRTDDKALLALSKLKLERTALNKEAAEGVMSVSLQADSTAPLNPVDADLLAHPALPALPVKGAKSRSTASSTELVDSLAAKLGRSAVRGLRIVDDHRPEHAWSFERATHLRRSTSEPRTSAHRPLWLFDPPKPVDARQFELRSGPERIETGWWDTAQQHRDYFTAVSKDGVQCWLYRDRNERWYLHGYFS